MAKENGEIREVPQTEFQKTLLDTKESALKKYMKLVIGKKSFWALLNYEIIVTLFSWVPGALGYFLRKIFYPKLFKKCGKGVVFGKGLTIRHPSKIEIGDNVVIDDFCVLDAKGDNNEGIKIGNNVILARNTVVSCKGGNILIDDNTNISYNCIIHSESNVKLGKNILIAAYCYIIGGGMHSFERTDIPIIQQGSISKGITIEDNCWLGADVKILDGVTLGRDSVVGAGSVVNKNIPPFSVCAGIPAKVVKNRLKNNSKSK